MNTLRHLLAAVGEPLVEVLAAPAGLDVPITGLAIVDPDDEPDEHRGSLVLVVGARGLDAERLVRAAASAGAAAVAVKVAGSGAALRGVALDAGVALLAVPADVRWERLESLAAGVLDAGESAGPDDLFALAQTIALLTRGIVCIEDTASRVLAYSRSDGDDAQIDELRRLSILGWQGPRGLPAASARVGRVRPAARVARTSCTSTSTPSWVCGAGSRSGSTPVRARWARYGCRRARSPSPRARRTCWSAPRGWRRDTSSAAAAARGTLAPRARGGSARRPGEPRSGRGDLRARRARVCARRRVRGAGGRGRHARAVGGRAGRRRRGARRRIPQRRADGRARHARVCRVPRRARRPRRAALLRGVRRGGAGDPADAPACACRRARSAGRAGSPGRPDRGPRPTGCWPRCRTGVDVAAFDDLRAEVLLGQTLSGLRGRPDLRDPAVARSWRTTASTAGSS